MTIKACLKSMRLRTLPLSLSGVLAGIALAYQGKGLDWLTIVPLVGTAALLQVISNLSNELGDTIHGTDRADRQGIHYSIQDGEMTIREMKMLIGATVLCCCGCGLLMILASFRTLFAFQPIAFICLGAAAIWAAMHYTLGSNPYGYRGLGDAFVFVFFGLVATLGAAYICAHTLRVEWVLPACAFGFFSMGVLNVNNIRDMKSDEATRVTVALKMGQKRARVYQCVLIGLGWAAMVAFAAGTGAGAVSACAAAGSAPAATSAAAATATAGAAEATGGAAEATAGGAAAAASGGAAEATAGAAETTAGGAAAAATAGAAEATAGAAAAAASGGAAEATAGAAAAAASGGAAEATAGAAGCCFWAVARRWLFLLTLPLFTLHLRGVWKRSDRALDPMLPLLVMSTFLTSILFAVGLLG